MGLRALPRCNTQASWQSIKRALLQVPMLLLLPLTLRPEEAQTQALLSRSCGLHHPAADGQNHLSRTSPVPDGSENVRLQTTISQVVAPPPANKFPPNASHPARRAPRGDQTLLRTALLCGERPSASSGKISPECSRTTSMLCAEQQQAKPAGAASLALMAIGVPWSALCSPHRALGGCSSTGPADWL